MTKLTITKIWIAGLIALAAGLLVIGIGSALMLAYGGTFTATPGGNGYDFTPHMDGFFWMTVSLMIVGATSAVVGGIVQLVAWIGALINTYPLLDKTWFVVLLAGGLLSVAFGVLGFAVMVAYLIAGPDGMATHEPQLPVSMPPSRTLAPTN